MLTHRRTPSEFRIKMESEQSRIQHKLMKKCWGADFISPIEQELTSGKDFKVLDVGCGEGTWALQLSTDYPLANIVGLDKIPKFPKVFSQDNLQFVQGNILKGLPFEDNSFDFVHIRFLLMEFTDEQWENIVVNEIVRVCKPGGWIELLESEENRFTGPTSKRLITSVVSYLESRGIYITTLSEDILDLLNATDQFDTIYGDERLIPIGNWGGDIGKLALESFTNLFRMIGSRNFSDEEFETMIRQFEKEMEYYRTYIISRRICCQKNI